MQPLTWSDAEGIASVLAKLAAPGSSMSRMRAFLDGTLRLVDARVGVMFWADLPAAGRICVEVLDSTGWLSTDERRLFATDVREHLYRGSPFFQALCLRARASTGVVYTRKQIVSDQSWYAAEYVQSVYRELGIDHAVISLFRQGEAERWMGLALLRAWGDRHNFSLRERHIVQLLHRSVPFLYCASDCPKVANLPPRLRQVLHLLMLGCAEKAIAARLGLSRFTVHRHINRLYRQLDVQSHPELMARYSPSYAQVQSPP